jgi:hypothetical protein
VLRLGLLEGGRVRSGTNDLAASGADGFGLGTKTGDEIAKSGHGSKGSGEMGSVELERCRTDGQFDSDLVQVGCPREDQLSVGSETEALAELGGDLAVTGDAEGTDVVEIALASAFGDREDVVGVPERAAAGDGFHAEEREACGAGFAAGAFEYGEDGDGVGTAQMTEAAVAGEDLLAEVAGVGAKAPLVDTVVGAEGAATSGEDFEFAPAAERAAVVAYRQSLRADAAAVEGARNHPSGRIGGLEHARK